MKKGYCSLLLVVLSVIMLSACGNKEYSEGKNGQATRTTSEEAAADINEGTGGAQMQEMMIGVGGQKFRADLYDNETVRALQECLPMTLSMEELHGNEKFYYLDEGLPTNPENVSSIQTGDIMLFGSDCLVIFFENISASYSYTRIGHIEDAQGFAEALARGTVDVSFEVGE